MNFSELTELLVAQFGTDGILQTNTANPQPFLVVESTQIAEICRFLRDDDRLFFDFLACMTGIDNGLQVNTMEVVYNLTSIPYEHNLTLKVVLPRNAEGEPMPVVPTVSSVWRTADWHEREIYDLVGIHFDGHPDLRRILLPTDWVGHPLRKDYREMETYHGIKVK
ncbi:NADH-quinone oxidoreductase subunit C [Larkinella punicea]|uniref:NADH-quinone oxidoreductase subunit C n=1 Tax=Larkinella punicea TaxID=2315727 RepID=A0A368JIC3_9BACT|nr:NADH-quinone oxidoreductase subunit C [Larkinella punicea]RCR66796.1 NADH-quinone oxidoreductase subunit C [Larkinella punicea]